MSQGFPEIEDFRKFNSQIVAYNNHPMSSFFYFQRTTTPFFDMFNPNIGYYKIKSLARPNNALLSGYFLELFLKIWPLSVTRTMR